ncbi:MAG: STAS/SEC14 domain-containing protein [Smithella sp.]|jgi:hypothetical protein
MIEVISGLPDQVIGIEAKGKVTRSDYESVIIPLVEKKLRSYKKINFLYYIGDKFSGMEADAMWEDAKVGFSNLRAWNKIAVVSNVDWIRKAVKLFEFVIPGHVKVFANDQLSEALIWVSE